MGQKLDWLSLALAGLGIILCLVAGLSRLAGLFYVAGFQAITLFDAGTSLLIAAVFIKLQAMSYRPSRSL